MRQAKAKKASRKPRISNKKPLVEGLAKKKSRPSGFFTKMSDEELVEYAKTIIIARRIKSKNELRKKDNGLYDALIRRKLQNRIGLAKYYSKFTVMNEDELLDFAKMVIAEKGIKSRSELEKEELGLYQTLLKRRLMDKVGFKAEKNQTIPCNSIGHRKWHKLSDVAVLDIAQKLIIDLNIKSRNDFDRLDPSLWQVLGKRNLRGQLVFDGGNIRWCEMSDAELLQYAYKVIKAENISMRKELHRQRTDLYAALSKRGLLLSIKFKAGRKSWRLKSDIQILEIARIVIEENDIRSKSGLYDSNPSLYQQLCKRKLLVQLTFIEGCRNWISMSDDEVVQYAWKVILDAAIQNRVSLNKLDSSLYVTLRKRKLLDRAFSIIELSKNQQLQAGLSQAADAMEQFGDAQ
jgi:hypothetical protein